MMRILIALFLCISQQVLADSEWDKVQHALTTPTEITVHRSPNCNCCHKWIQHLETQGFTVIDQVTHNLEAEPARAKVPNVMRSCHTAVVDGYLIEGHVPADDIKRLLAEKPAIIGLSVPQMPVGTPGMEMGMKKDNFSVISFDKDNQYRMFNRYQVGPDQQYHSVIKPE